MNGDFFAVILLATVAVAWAWLHGYDRGYEAMRRRATKSLRYSAALHRANGLAIGPVPYGQADALEAAADRFDREPTQPPTES